MPPVRAPRRVRPNPTASVRPPARRPTSSVSSRRPSDNSANRCVACQRRSRTKWATSASNHRRNRSIFKPLYTPKLPANNASSENPDGRANRFRVFLTRDMRPSTNVRVAPRTRSWPMRYHWLSKHPRCNPCTRRRSGSALARAGRFFVIELHLLPAQHGVADRLERLQVGHAAATRAGMKRHRAIKIVPAETDLLGQRGGEFFKRRTQRLFVGSAPVLFQRPAGHEQRHQLAFRNLHAGKLHDRARVEKTASRRAVVDGQFELVAHELDVALHGFRGHFQFPGQPAAIRETSRLEQSVEMQHPPQRWPGVPGGQRTFAGRGGGRDARTGTGCSGPHEGLV